MRKIAIIGAGQTGLLAAHGLLGAGYDITLYSDRSPEQFLTETTPTGAAARFAEALALEKELGLNYWVGKAPRIDGVEVVVSLKPARPFIVLNGRLSGLALAIDLRLQSARWMADLEERGGKIEIGQVDVAHLEKIAGEHDLSVLATGRGALARLFPRDEERSVYSEPQRNLAMVVVHNTADHCRHPNLVKFNLTAPHGEAFWGPFFHKDLGPTWSCIFEARPGGPMDRFGNAATGDEAVQIGKEVIADHFPWDREWIEPAKLADEHGWLTGSITPTVRHPVGTLPSGRVVTGIGDTVMSFDPIGGQGANAGNRMAKNLIRSVVERGDDEFDEQWMRDTFEAFYTDAGEVSYRFNNILLEPMTRAGKRVLIAQHGSDGRRDGAQQAIANSVTDNFANPRTITDCLADTDEAAKFLSRATGRPWQLLFLGGLRRVMRDQLRRKIGLKPVAEIRAQE